jgi:hypothetical protein
VHRSPDQVEALERSRWLAELAQAIAQAQKLAWSLGVVEGDSGEARSLYARLEAVRSEVDSLRFGDWANVRREIDPSWVEDLLNGALPGRNASDA